MSKQRADAADLDNRECPLIRAAERAAFEAQEEQVSSSAPSAGKRFEKIQLPGYRLLDEIHSGRATSPAENLNLISP